MKTERYIIYKFCVTLLKSVSTKQCELVEDFYPAMHFVLIRMQRVL